VDIHKSEPGVAAMDSLAKMKAQMLELEGRKKELEADIQKADRYYKIGLWGAVIGIPLIALYGTGLILVLGGGLMALINSGKRASFKDRLENIEVEIHRLKISMA
jgi:hypothetical protein